ncbi:MAG: sulfurtransferase TusA family protein [SAR202 cluster bacterium]|jgi:tRNA 2-thiouridine synthesizing protein A|nr:sulfurtransferase TusA family protein [SAR202 cluster bacterium]|tara:strand:- start:11898 stop:12149 length:252 start_codon:yes stop_codon:yes gene_type:complete
MEPTQQPSGEIPLELNCLGMRCPLPIIATAKAIASEVDGFELLLLSDDPATEVDLGAWSRMTGNQVKVLGANRFAITKDAKQD